MRLKHPSSIAFPTSPGKAGGVVWEILTKIAHMAICLELRKAFGTEPGKMPWHNFRKCSRSRLGVEGKIWFIIEHKILVKSSSGMSQRRKLRMHLYSDKIMSMNWSREKEKKPCQIQTVKFTQAMKEATSAHCLSYVTRRAYGKWNMQEQCRYKIQMHVMRGDVMKVEEGDVWVENLTFRAQS